MNIRKILPKSHNQTEEVVHVWIPKKRMRRPFPLRWGIAALALFGVFAVITQLQFSKLSADKLYDTKVAAYQSDVEAYDAAIKSVEECYERIAAREVYRELFTNLIYILEVDADPGTIKAVEEKIRVPLTEGLPTLNEEDCPTIPDEKPVKPTR